MWDRIVLAGLLPALLLLFSCGKEGAGGDAPPAAQEPGATRDNPSSAEEVGPSAAALQETLRQMQEGDRTARDRAAERICHMGRDGAKVLGPVRKLLASADPRTREAAAYALG